MPRVLCDFEDFFSEDLGEDRLSSVSWPAVQTVVELLADGLQLPGCQQPELVGHDRDWSQHDLDHDVRELEVGVERKMVAVCLDCPERTVVVPQEVEVGIHGLVEQKSKISCLKYSMNGQTAFNSKKHTF